MTCSLLFAYFAVCGMQSMQTQILEVGDDSDCEEITANGVNALAKGLSS